MDETKILDGLSMVEANCRGWGEGEVAAAAYRFIKQLSAENKRLAAEVKRLTPKAMTDDEACALLNEIAYSGGSDWKPDEYGHGYIQSEWLKEGMGSWTAHAIAAQLLREKEAGRG